MFKVTPIPAFNDNYIWALSVPGKQQIAVIDPGTEDVVNQYLKENQLELAAILITHHHNDHTGGVEQLQQQHNCSVYGPASSPFKAIENRLKDADQIELLGQQLEVREVPGHTLDHISYYQPDHQPQLFCGDTLFLAGCGRLFEGTAEQMHQAMQYFNSLPDSTEIYCTHEYSLANLKFAAAVEPDNMAISEAQDRCTELRESNLPTLPTSIATEKKINPFLRYSSASVKAAAEDFTGRSLVNETDIFTAIREWKNQF